MKTLLSVATLLTTLAIAQAQNFTATLDGAQDGGGARTGTGTGTFSLSGNTLSLNVVFSGLSGTWTADHIHGPAAPGASANVLYSLGSLTTLDAGSHSGTISGNVTLTDGIGGFTVAQQMSQLNGSLWYVNIHTSPTFGGGEIRGQILPVPEPSTMALGALGALMIGYFVRRNRANRA